MSGSCDSGALIDAAGRRSRPADRSPASPLQTDNPREAASIEVGRGQRKQEIRPSANPRPPMKRAAIRKAPLGTSIDLSQVTCDKFFVAGVTDRITPWKGGCSRKHLSPVSLFSLIPSADSRESKERAKP